MATTPSFFDFLKEGLLLPTKNPRLFAAVFAIIVTASFLLLLGNDLDVRRIQPLVDEISVDTNALNSTDPGSPEFHHLLQEILDDTRAIFISSTLYTLVAAVIRSLTRIVVLFTAVTTYSGELHSFASLLGKVKTNLIGPSLTVGFIYVLQIITYLALIVGMVVLFAFVMMITMKQNLAVLFVGPLLMIATFIFFAYFSIIGTVSVVLAVAEPGCQGACAVRRAWGTIKGKGKLMRAVLFIFLTLVLDRAIRPVHTLAKTCSLTNMASGLLLGLLYTILMAAVQLFDACAMTAFYYECKGSTNQASVMEYIKLSTKDQIYV